MVNTCPDSPAEPTLPEQPMDAAQPDRIITTSEAGKILGVSRATVRQLCLRGQLPHSRPGTRKFVLRLKDVTDFAAAHTCRGETKQNGSPSAVESIPSGPA